jgi:hypothetical protein
MWAPEIHLYLFPHLWVLNVCHNTRLSLNINEWVSYWFYLFFVNLTQTEVSRKRDPKLRKYLYIRLAYMKSLGAFSWLMSSLWGISPLLGVLQLWVIVHGLMKKAGWSSHRKQISKQCSSTGSAWVPHVTSFSDRKLPGRMRRNQLFPPQGALVVVFFTMTECKVE